MLDFTPLVFDSLERSPTEGQIIEYIRDHMRTRGIDWVAEALEEKKARQQAKRDAGVRDLVKRRMKEAKRAMTGPFPNA